MLFLKILRSANIVPNMKYGKDFICLKPKSGIMKESFSIYMYIVTIDTIIIVAIKTNK